MGQNKAASWAYAEEQSNEPELIAQARAEAEELGIVSLSPATGRFLALLASLPHIHSIAEVGTGTGVSALYMLGASPQATITTIDIEAEAQNYARRHFSQLGLRTSRYRLINGRSADLLPRLADAAYDLVLIDGDPLEAAGDTQEAVRMLRPGGILLVAHALNGDRVANPARRDEATVSLRNLGLEILESEALHSSLIPLGDGLLVAVKR